MADFTGVRIAEAPTFNLLSSFYWWNSYTSTGTGTPPPTEGQLWPRGNP